MQSVIGTISVEAAGGVEAADELAVRRPSPKEYSSLLR